MITAEREDGVVVEIRPGEAICGHGFFSITLTPALKGEYDPWHSGSEAEYQRMCEWFGNLAATRLMRRPKEKK